MDKKYVAPEVEIIDFEVDDRQMLDLGTSEFDERPW